VTFEVRLPPFRRPNASDVGYPVHESCWRLLHRWARFLGVEDLTDPRYTSFLFQLHNSSLDGSGSLWADDYAGLLDLAGVHR
jgi:hypothetical protein